MSVEMRSAPSAPPASPVKSPASSQGTAHAGDAKASGGRPSPFLALLAALEPASEPVLAGTVVGETQGLPLDAADSSAAPDPGLDAATLLAQNLGVAGAPGETASEASLELSDAGLADGATEGTGLRTDGAASTGAGAAAKAAKAQEDAAVGRRGARDAAEQQASSPADLRRGQATTLAAGRAAAARAGDQQQQLGVDLRQAAEAQQGTRERVGGDWKSLLAAAPGAGTASTGENTAWSEGAAWLKPQAGPRPIGDRAPTVRAGSATVVGAWSGQGSDTSVSSNGAAAAPTPVFSLEAGGESASSTLAEKLSFWVSKGVQNAELQLDAFGGGAVDVSIALNGREAQIEFRSDVPEARRMLQDAMPQLRDMLQSEGLVLSGGFVGTSAQGDPGAQERRAAPPPGARSGTLRMDAVAEREAPAGAGLAARGGTAGRNVDLFV